MTKKHISGVGIAVRILIIIALAIAIYYVWQWRSSGPLAMFNQEVQHGDTREGVVAIMGPTDRESDTFPLPNKDHLAGEAEKVPVEAWLVWDVGMGVKCVVGLDADGRVVYKGNTGR